MEMLLDSTSCIKILLKCIKTSGRCQLHSRVVKLGFFQRRNLPPKYLNYLIDDTLNF